MTNINTHARRTLLTIEPDVRPSLVAAVLAAVESATGRGDTVRVEGNDAGQLMVTARDWVEVKAARAARWPENGTDEPPQVDGQEQLEV
jgi:hypothetical protein